MKAVILAAGSGGRLMGLNQNKPKAFLQIGKRPIIEHQLSALKAVGLENKDIYIIIGYGGQEIWKEYKNCCILLMNQAWNSTNTAASVQIACKHLITNDGCLLIINGDTIFDPELIKILIKSQHPDAAIVQYKSVGDEEIAFTTKDGLINKIGKKIANAEGEATGVYKIGPHTIKQYYQSFMADEATKYYEDVFNRLAIKLLPIDAKDLLITEIDTPEDYHQALTLYDNYTRQKNNY